MNKWFYIQWHNDTHNRPQMQDIIMDCGWESYGIYVALTEILHKNGGALPLFSLKSVAWSLHISTERLREFVERFIAAGVMEIDNENLLSSDVKQQFSKQERAIAAANVRWENARKQIPEEHKAELPPVETELSDNQKQSVDLLINKLKYTQDRAEKIARAYEYDYIIEKMNYLMEMIKKHNNIQSPHAYFEKALKDNWISSNAIVEEKPAPTNNISLEDIDTSKFIMEFKNITSCDFPQDCKKKLRDIVGDKELNVMLALDVVRQNYDNDDFFKAINIERKDILSGSAFLNRQTIENVVEYWRRHNVFAGQSLDDVINIIGGVYGQ